jgi:FkbM family methyltransferase
MSEWMSRLLRWIRVLRMMKSQDLEGDLKRRIRLAYLKTVVLKHYDAVNNTAEIGDQQVKFCTYASYAHLFNEIFVDQQYHFVADRENPFIIDCGSNIGMSVLYFKMLYPRSTILAFEPDRDAFLCLVTNIRANGLESVFAEEKALSSRKGQTTLYYDRSNPGALGVSTIRERMPKEKRAVEAVRLSEYIDREVDFLKMDVEGAEGDILEEVSGRGKLSLVRRMVIEFHHHITKDRDVLSRILGLLEVAGFGYQVQAAAERPFKQRQFQDILIYAYRKDDKK